MQNMTTFETKERYIFLSIFLTAENGKRHELDAILDTGAPRTEFSDEALHFAGFAPKPRKGVALQEGLQTQKYTDIVLPKIEICSHHISDLKVYVSHFEKSWGVDALIGLDFFRQFRVTIDYEAGQVVTEPLKGNYV